MVQYGANIRTNTDGSKECSYIEQKAEDMIQTANFQKIGELWMNAISNEVKESTFVKYHNFFYNHLIPELGEVPISQINSDILRKFALKKLETGRLDKTGGLSTKTVRDLLSVIREIIKFAQEKGVPISGTFKHVHIKMQEKPPKLVSQKEQRKLEQYLIANNSPKNLGILICLYMGLRIGELCALKWKDIQMEEEVLNVQHTMQRIQTLTKESGAKTEIIITSPKSASSNRSIPIPSFIVSLLEKLEATSQDAFFLTGKTNKFVEPRSYQYYYKKIIKQNGIQYTNFHVLRHTFATRCVENDFDIKSLSEILGHSSVNITLNKYVHASMELKRKNMSRMHLISATSNSDD